MYASLLNKVVCITGGVSGIGRAVAKRFNEEGAMTIVLDKKIKDQEDFVQKNNIYYLGADVSSRKSMELAFVVIMKKFKKIDIVVANAGISIRHKFIDIKQHEWKNIMNTNLDGVFNTAQLAARHMLKNRQGGVILLMGSTNGLGGHAYYADYNASKAAVILLGKTMARELAPRIRVNTICPGYVLTAMQKREYSSAMIQRVNQSLPLRRHAMPKEIANVMVFLASQEAAYITGQSIVIDGGETA